MKESKNEETLSPILTCHSPFLSRCQNKKVFTRSPYLSSFIGPVIGSMSLKSLPWVKEVMRLKSFHQPFYHQQRESTTYYQPLLCQLWKRTRLLLIPKSWEQRTKKLTKYIINSNHTRECFVVEGCNVQRFISFVVVMIHGIRPQQNCIVVVCGV